MKHKPAEADWDHAWKGNGSSPYGSLALEMFDNIQVQTDVLDFVQGLLIEGSTAIVYGEPNSGKTFWVTDLALHVAYGQTWCERRVEQGGVVYCTLEGSSGFRNRIAAWKCEHAPSPGHVRFAAVSSQINLLDPMADTERLITAIHEASTRFDMPTKLAIIDTLSRALAGGNENGSEDMGRLIANIDRIRAETGAALLLVHHCGKDTTRGARGHSLARGAVDTEIEVTADANGNRQAEVVKQREMESGDVFPFRLERIELGSNRHGEKITSCIVIHGNAERPIQQKAARKLPPAAEIGMRALRQALSRHSQAVPTGPEWPPNVLAVKIEDWRQAYYQLKGDSADANRQAFHRARDYLLAAIAITQQGGLVWPVRDRPS